MTTVGEMLQTAIGHHQAGRLPEAEQIYRQILSTAPQHSDAWHLLGVMAYQVGKYAAAIELSGRAVALQPSIAAYHANLGEAYRASGDLAKAEPALLRAIELDPNQPEVRNNYALLLQTAGRAADSLAMLERALQLNPNYPEAHNNRGLALEHLGRYDEARQAYVAAYQMRPQYRTPVENLERFALRLRSLGRLHDSLAAMEALAALCPQSAPVLANVGVLQFELNKFAEAADSCRRTLQLDPRQASPWNNLGSSVLRLQQYDEAEKAFLKAIELKPDYIEAMTNLGTLYECIHRDDQAAVYLERALKLDPGSIAANLGLGLACYRRGMYQQAVDFYRRALDTEPNNTDTINKLGTCVMAQGMPAEAIPLFARCRTLDPKMLAAHSNYLFCHQYLPEMTLARLAQLHREFETQHAAPLYTEVQRHDNVRDPEKRLRIGFVSADLRRHPIGFLLVDLFAQIDRTAFEIACYSTRRGKDEIREQLKAASGVWRDVEMLADDKLAEQIRADQVDILFDLSGHTSGGKLLVFARRPAPVQLTWMGYPSTTGIRAIDGLLSDRWMTPEGVEPHFAERIIRMPAATAIYRPPTDLPEIGKLPQLQQPSITLGSFNNIAKVNEPVVALWCRVLHSLPGSRMFLKFRALNETSVQDRIARMFANHGIGRERLEFQPFSPLREMLGDYNRVDLALDTFPYSGGTTTMLALLMGVPVVTLPGETMASRQSLSVLKSIGVEECIANDADDFVRRATALALDRARLSELRETLRPRMLSSTYCDAPRFVKDFEVTLRTLWREWCVK